MYCYGRNQVSFIQRCPLFGRTFSEVEQVPSLPPLLFLHSMSLPFSLLPPLPPSLPLCRLCVNCSEARLATGAGGEGEVDGGSRKKRSGSNPKNISLELTYKSGGLEHKLVLSPATSHARKQGAEWLKSLKKVRRKISLTYTLKGTWQYVWAKFNNRDTVKRITFHF